MWANNKFPHPLTYYFISIIKKTKGNISLFQLVRDSYRIPTKHYSNRLKFTS